jgi:hypothetical protein
MALAGSTPEELETLLEDAFLQQDVRAIAELFEAGGVLLTGSDVWQAASALCGQRFSFLANARLICRADDTAILLGTNAISVARRGRDGYWRFLFCYLGNTSEGDGQ